ncbi:hypothetical protein MATL_G00116820 [Megalops atlanticus]|uniref:Aftiphilin clathrin-binding box domain-containing protein n=1 Tax=Megalops atlanticus TaxID=7932 RepID=A0A9D3PWX8_MEGAT|nr:hypothetical protein MATL_G00116820 [Megalops atlanticus]
MLQQNNNNNYSCLERAFGSGGVLQERERGGLPFARLLEMGSFPEVGDVSQRPSIRGFRAWALSSVCARSRRWAALPPANTGPYTRGTDGTTPCQTNGVACSLRPQKGRLAHGPSGVGLGLQLDAGAWSRSSGSRQGSLGALVTVATLKASERGGQTQTQCFLLQAKGRSYLCAPGRRKAAALGLTPDTPTGLKVGDTVAGDGSEKRHTSVKGSEQRDGAAAGVSRVKLKSVRKWRTSCGAASPPEERAPGDCKENELPALEGSQENRAEQDPWTSRQDAQAKQRENQITDMSRPAPMKICAECRGLREAPAISQKRTDGDQDELSGGVVEKEVISLESGPCVCRLLPDLADPDGDQRKPSTEDLQGGVQPRSSAQKVSRFQDLLGDKSPRLGASSEGEAAGAMRNTCDLESDLIADTHECCEENTESGAIGDKGTTLDQDSKGCRTSGRTDSACNGGAEESGWVTADVPVGHSCEEVVSAQQDSWPCTPDQWEDLAKGDCSTLVVSSSGCTKVENLCNGIPEEITGRELEGVQTVSVAEVAPHGVEHKAITGDYPAEGKSDSLEHETGPEQTEETRALGSHSGKETRSGGLRGGPNGAEEPGTTAPPPAPDEEGGRRREADDGDLIWQPGNSLSRGPDSDAASAAHALRNPAPPGAMATAHSAQGRRQAESGGGTPALSEEQQQQQQQDWCGGMVASGEGCLDVQQEGDDDFGLFVQAGEQSSWDDGFTDFHQVPCGKSESIALADSLSESEPADWTSSRPESPFYQSGSVWTAFTEEGDVALHPGHEGRQQTHPGGQWWPQKAVEEWKETLPTALDVPSVFQKAFPVAPPSCPVPNQVPTLRQHLQGLSSDGSAAGNNGRLLDGLQDVNKMIGLKCKWAESHSQKLLLQCLHLDTFNKDHVTGFRLANDSPSLDLPSFSQRSPPMDNGKTRLSYDMNKNVLA